MRPTQGRQFAIQISRGMKVVEVQQLIVTKLHTKEIYIQADQFYISHIPTTALAKHTDHCKLQHHIRMQHWHGWKVDWENEMSSMQM